MNDVIKDRIKEVQSFIKEKIKQERNVSILKPLLRIQIYLRILQYKLNKDSPNKKYLSLERIKKNIYSILYK